MDWMDYAKSKIGVKEKAGDEDHPDIVEFLSTVFSSPQHDEVAWCSAFVNWCLLKAGYAGTLSAAAISFRGYGKKLDKPVPGAVMVFKRGTESWQAHVTFFDSMFNGQYRCLGGNQHDSVCYEVFDPKKLIWMGYPSVKEMRT